MRRISALILLSLLVTGCAGSKRLPPVQTLPGESDGPGSGGPNLLGVGLVENVSDLTIRTEGPARLLDAASGKTLVEVGAGDPAIFCRRDGSRITWRHGGREGGGGPVILRPVDVATRVGYGDEVYRGELLVIVAPRGGGLTLVNTLDLESYLKGVVPWEIGRHGDDKLAALQAQAIAARTYTVSHLGARRSRGFDVFASVMDQVYKGAGEEDVVCNEAVDSTAGLVLRHDAQEIEAYYSACCGGISSSIAEVWAKGPRPYLRVADDGPAADGDVFCATSDHYHWRETWTIGQLEEILAETLPAYLDWLAERPARAEWAGPVFSPREAGRDPRHPGRLWNLEIISRTASGRVADLAVGTDAGVYHVRGDRTRWVLRPADGHPFIMRSALFDVELERDGNRLIRVATRGRGYGHGIGMCQTGALERAAQGQSFREILGHYYPRAELSRLTGADSP